MRSIRRTIAVWTLPGIAALWLAGGATVFVASRGAMIATIDRDNLALTREVRAATRSRGGGWPGAPAGEQPVLPEQEGLFYQVWSLDGSMEAKSASLGADDLSLLDPGDEISVSAYAKLAGGKRVRVSVTRFAAGHGSGRRGPGGGPGGGPGQPVTIAVGRDLSQFDARSLQLLAGLAGTGLLAVGATAGLLALGLRKGLRPLDELGEKAGSIDPESLHERFGGGSVPRELEAIVARFDSLMSRLEAGFERERRFSSDLAHELRTPLAEIRLKTDLALRWPEERTEDLFHGISAVAGRIERVVDTLLQLARVEADGGGFTREPVELGALITESWEPQAERAAQMELSFQSDWPPDRTLPGDATLWRTLIGNLLANAAEYGCKGGVVAVDPIDSGVRISNSVEGFDPEAVEHLFDRFWRADGSRSNERHSGLGLSLVKACAGAMGYAVTAELCEDAEDGERLLFEIRAS